MTVVNVEFQRIAIWIAGIPGERDRANNRAGRADKMNIAHRGRVGADWRIGQHLLIAETYDAHIARACRERDDLAIQEHEFESLSPFGVKG